ncbi:MAG TPA: undecaprenyl-diphosphate phosphatase, partial [Gemmatimonadetes bacterium]|nr:undecaprenyl-diphosphate phosphatase [Gemmatimonadota bacterium]
MTKWDAFLLGIVQGATEFLPVSSSGHLVIVQSLLSVNVEGVAFEVIVHLGTLVSILLVYFSRINELTVGVLRNDRRSLSYAGLLFVATIPAGLIGILAKEPIELLFDAPAVPGIALL